MDTLEKNALLLKERLDKAAAGAPYTLLAATKTQPAEIINRLPSLGIYDYGENRVQEWMEKCGKIDESLNYHHIGRLQRNKIKYIIKKVILIHSVDHVALARAISDAALAADRRVDILLQINPAEEEQKGGVLMQDLPALYEACLAMPGICVKGLMCMAPLTDDQALVHQVFAKARRAFDELAGVDKNITTLSMGMSGDAEIALNEGATMVRIGTALFGRRQ